MYRCQQCKRVSTPTERQHKKVLETRAKTYPEREKYKDRGGHGTETVREITVCGVCAVKSEVPAAAVA